MLPALLVLPVFLVHLVLMVLLALLVILVLLVLLELLVVLVSSFSAPSTRSTPGTSSIPSASSSPTRHSFLNDFFLKDFWGRLLVVFECVWRLVWGVFDLHVLSSASQGTISLRLATYLGVGAFNRHFQSYASQNNIFSEADDLVGDAFGMHVPSYVSQAKIPVILTIRLVALLTGIFRHMLAMLAFQLG